MTPEDRRHYATEALGIVKVLLSFALLFMGASFGWAVEQRNDASAGMLVLAIAFGCGFFALVVMLVVYGRSLLPGATEARHGNNDNK